MRVLFAAAICGVLAGPAFGATRTVEATLDASSAEILNLVGTARLAPGEGPIRVVATITAEDPAHAEAVSLVRTEEGGRARLELRYPQDVDKVRVDLEEFSRINTRVTYLDRKIRLDDRSGDGQVTRRDDADENQMSGFLQSLGLPFDLDVRGRLFTDVGAAWAVDEGSVDVSVEDSSAPRVTVVVERRAIEACGSPTGRIC